MPSTAVAIDKIERYTATMTFADFLADERTVDAVLRNFANTVVARGTPWTNTPLAS